MRAMKISRWNEHRKGYLLGFADIETEEGYIVRGVTVHKKDGKRWCNPPARKYTTEDGEAGWQRIFDFFGRHLS